jgi:CheY-like chemotaxis protein
MRPAQIVLSEDNSGDVFWSNSPLKESDVSCEIPRFSTGHEAVGSLCGQPDEEMNTIRPDAILLDLNTPQSDGFEVIAKLKHAPTLRMCQLQSLLRRMRLRIGVAALCLVRRYIRKPSSLEGFLTTVGQAVKDTLHG